MPTAKLFLPVVTPRRSGRCSRTRSWPTPTELIGKRRGRPAFYSGPLAEEIGAVGEEPAEDTGYDPAGDARLPDHGRPREVQGDRPRRRPRSSTTAWTSTAWRRPRLAVPRSARRSTSSRRRTCRKQTHPAGAAQLPRGVRAVFADRGAYVGDPAFVDVPTKELLSTRLRRRALLPDRPGQGRGQAGASRVRLTARTAAARRTSRPRRGPDTEGLSTTHLVAADKWGNVVSYTLTIEQTGGSGITVPGRGFLLNNELTDFSTVYDAGRPEPDPARASGRARRCRRPSCCKHGKPFLALGSPGGSTIITTVLQTLTNRLDRGMTLPEAVAAPRASQRNTPTVTAEPAVHRGATAPP